MAKNIDVFCREVRCFFDTYRTSACEELTNFVGRAYYHYQNKVIMATVLVAFDTVDEGFERISAEHDLIRPPKGRDFDQQELAELIPMADVLCSVFDIPVGEPLLRHATKLRLVANYAVGYNNIDLDYARTYGIAVTNTPRAVVAPTAELALALMLSCSRRTAELDRLVRAEQGRVSLGRLGLLGTDLYGKTLGIVGYGNIGGAVAERCRAFGMRILYYKRTRLSPEIEASRGLEYAPLDDLLARADIVSLHTPYSPASHHQIGARELALMRRGSILINTARGSIVDEDALINALRTGHIASAGLDVFEDKDVPRPGLLSLPQVVMTPHVGTQTYDARVAMVHELADNVLGFLAGRTDISRVV